MLPVFSGVIGSNKIFNIIKKLKWTKCIWNVSFKTLSSHWRNITPMIYFTNKSCKWLCCIRNVQSLRDNSDCPGWKDFSKIYIFFLVLVYVSRRYPCVSYHCSLITTTIKTPVGVSSLWSYFLFPTTSWALTRYVKLRVAHAPGMPGTISPPPWVSDPDMHQGQYSACWSHLKLCENKRFISIWSSEK